MIVTKDENGISVVGREFFDVADTLGCGQTFRFRSDGDGYVVRTADAVCRVRQTADGARIDTDDPDRFYRVEVRREAINIKTFGSLINQVLPVRVNTEGLLMHTASELYMLPCEEESYTAAGDLLMRAGLVLQQSFTGTGYNDAVRLMPDFSGRLYFLRATEEPEEKE